MNGSEAQPQASALAEPVIVVGNQTTVRSASFRALSGSHSGELVEVHFNPETLDYSVRTNLKDTGAGNQAKQYASKVTAKLSMQLLFDTTHTGGNVLDATHYIRRYLYPDKESKDAPPVVEFAWGAFRFAGMLEGYRESIEFFSSEGMPLRAALSIELAQQDSVIAAPDERARAALEAGPGAEADAALVPSPAGFAGSASALAARGGDARAARALGAANGLESLRFAAASELAVARETVSAAARPLVRAAEEARAAAGPAFAALRTGAAQGRALALNADQLLGELGSAAALDPYAAGVSVTGRALGAGSRLGGGGAR